MAKQNLNGKIALITGAASGLGRQTAIRLLKEKVRFILYDIDLEGLKETQKILVREGGDVLSIHQIDITSISQVKKTAQEVLEGHVSIDLLVNNAGICKVARIQDTTLEQWEAIIKVNLMGMVYMTHAFLPEMIKRKSGHIANVASVADLSGSFGFGAYCASKFAVVGMSEVLRAELAYHKIDVSVLCPYIMPTPMADNIEIIKINADCLLLDFFNGIGKYKSYQG